MDKLKDSWLTDGLIDFEYKKYQLLAYFKTVNESFHRMELYPLLSDLVFHYRNLILLKENQSLIRESFPKELSPESFTNMIFNYRRIIEDDLVMKEIEPSLMTIVPLKL